MTFNSCTSSVRQMSAGLRGRLPSGLIPVSDSYPDCRRRGLGGRLSGFAEAPQDKLPGAEHHWLRTTDIFYSSLHREATWDGAGPSAEPSSAHIAEARETCALAEQDTCAELTQFQGILTPWDARVRFPLGVVTQRSPESTKVWGVLTKASCGQGQATRPRSRDRLLTPGVTSSGSPPRWASASHAQLQLARRGIGLGAMLGAGTRPLRRWGPHPGAGP